MGKDGVPHPSTLAMNNAKRVVYQWAKENHPEVWARILGDEREKLGLPRQVGQNQTYQKRQIEELQAEVAQLRMALARIASAPTAEPSPPRLAAASLLTAESPQLRARAEYLLGTDQEPF